MIETDRLLLRRWARADRAPFSELNSDPRVMEFFPAVLSHKESEALIDDHIEPHFATYGFGPFAAELRETREFIGFIGLAVPRFDAHFTPCVEIAWRLGATFWGAGLATEGARAVLNYAFENLKLAEVVAMTVPANLRSRRVMEKLAMRHNPDDDFDHPDLPVGHPLRRHVLYRITAPQPKPARR